MTMQSIVNRLLGVVTTIILARGLGTTSFGLYNAVINTMHSVYGMLTFGLDAGLHVLTAESKQDENAISREYVIACALRSMFFLGILASGCIFFGAEILAERLFGMKDLSSWLKYSAALVFLQFTNQFCFSTISGLGKFQIHSISLSVVALVNFVCLTIGVLKWGLRGALTALICVQAISLLVNAAITVKSLREINMRLKFAKFKLAAAQLLQIGLPFYLSGFCLIPVRYCTQGLMSSHIGVESLGYLRIIVSMDMFVAFVPVSIAAVMTTILTEMRSNREGNMSTFMKNAFLNSKCIWVYCLSSALVLYPFIPWLIKCFYGQSYTHVAPLSRLSLFIAVMLAAINSMNNIFLASKRLKFMFFQVIVQTIFFASAAYILIPRFGIKGYIAAELSGYSAMCAAGIVGCYFLQDVRGCGIRPLIRMYILTLLIIFEVLAMQLLSLSALMSNLIIIGTLLVTCIGCLYFVFNQYEKRVIKKSLSLITNKVRSYSR